MIRPVITTSGGLIALGLGDRVHSVSPGEAQDLIDRLQRAVIEATSPAARTAASAATGQADTWHGGGLQGRLRSTIEETA